MYCHNSGVAIVFMTLCEVCACACVSLFLIVLFCCVKRLGVSVSVAALMWRMAHPPAAVHWTRRPRRAPAWFCTPTSRATTSGGSPSSTARTVTTTSRQSPCRETPPSPPSCECCVFIYTEEMNHVNSVRVCVILIIHRMTQSLFRCRYQLTHYK